MATTLNRAYRYPVATDPFQPHTDIQRAAEDIDVDVQAMLSAWATFGGGWFTTGTGIALGNGAYDNWYKQVGKTVHWRFGFLPGTTTAFGSGSYQWQLPIPMAGTPQNVVVGAGYLLDEGSSNYSAVALGFDATRFQVFINSGAALGATVPAAWTAGNRLYVAGTYEAA